MAGWLSRRCRRTVAVVAAGGGRRLPRPAPRRLSVAVLAAILVPAAGLTLAVAVGPVQAQAQADAWKPCSSAAANGRIERVEILLALDRSGSLQTVDPSGTKRRRATHGTRERLALLADSVSQLLRESGAGLDFGIDAALVAFDTEGETLAGFAPVAADHPSDSAIDAALGAGGNTDYGPAVEQALVRFENSPNADSDTTCRILVLFTDGILDPYDTAAGGRPALESQATAHVSNLLADLCGTDPGMRRYRQRMEGLGVSTYVAVLKGLAFDRGAGGSHLDELAKASKQTILAVTGHGDSPLLGGVTAAAGCESWSGVRAGKVLEIEDIGDLTDELANAVGEVGLAVRQPRIRCSRQPTIKDPFEDEWPHRLIVGDRAAESLCTITAPLDGEVNLSVSGEGLPAGVEWLIDDGGDEVQPAASRTLAARDAGLSFTVVSSPLPEDEPVGALADAAVRIAATWYPDPEQLLAWPDQPPEVPLTTTLRFDVGDREAYWVERLIDCREHQRSSWADVPAGAQAEAVGLCDVEDPPAGEFEMVLVDSESNRLTWSATEAVAGGDPQRVQRGEPVLIMHDGAPVVLGSVSSVLAAAEVPLEGFEDDVGFRLTWRSPRGAVLVERTVAEVEIDVRPAGLVLIECGAEAQVTDARQSPSGEWALVVDSGCRLLSPPQGTVRATVGGDVRGEAWKLVDPPAAGEESWRTRDDVALTSSEPDRTLFVGVGPPELADRIGDDVEFTLAATWSGGGSAALDEQRVPRTATVYLPVPRCESRVEAVRVDVDPSGGGRPEQWARAANLCEVDPPPNGRLEVRTAGAPPGPDLSWRPVRDGDATDVLIVEPGDSPVSVGATTGPLAPGLIGSFETGIDVYLDWRSARGHSSGSDRRVTVAVPEEPPELLDCSGEPGARRSAGEVPEVPLTVDTGCVLPAPEAGVVTLGVEGSISGVRWRLPGPVSLAPGDADHPILIESDGPLPNEPLAAAPSFELAATLTLDGYEPPADRRRRDVTVRLERRIRIRCSGTPQIVGAPIEVPEAPLTVDTGCTLLAPGVGTVTVRVDGDVAGVPWGFPAEVRLSPGDDDLPILIETAAPLPNRRYETVAEFALAATWRSPDGLEQSVGEQPPPSQAPPEVAVALRARPSTGAAALIAAALLLAGVLVGWLVLWILGRRASRRPSSGEYRVVWSDAQALVTPGGGVDLPGFDVASVLGSGSAPLVRRRAGLRADGLTIRARVQWWNPRDLLGGGRAEVVLPGRRELHVAASPSSGEPGCLSPSLAPGAAIVALARDPAVSRPDEDRHSARVWLLIPSAGPRTSIEQEAAGNLRGALAELARRLAGQPPDGASSRPTPGPASGAYPRQPRPPEPRPKG